MTDVTVCNWCGLRPAKFKILVEKDGNPSHSMTLCAPCSHDAKTGVDFDSIEPGKPIVGGTKYTVELL